MNKKQRLNIFRVFLFAGTIISLYFVPWILVKAWILPLPKTIDEQINQSIDLGFEGMIVYVNEAGKQPVTYTGGFKNREQQVPTDPDALFKIASISKLYDAVAVTKLVGKGRLSLDTTLAEFLPELVGKIEHAETITLRLMIQHRSGIPNFTDTPDFWAHPTTSFEESLALIEGKPANFKPGNKYEYCNTNYLLINKIMDDVLGYPNFQFIQDEILNPLQLHNTFSSVNEVNINNVMGGYHVGYPHDLKNNDFGMHATAEDVGKFIRALNEGTVFKNDEKEIYASIYEFEHSGWVPGYQSFAHYYEDIDTVVVCFYNTTDPKLLYWNLSEINNKRIFKILEKKNKTNRNN
ncbi:serine hydrolase domain-containing protein [Mangrovimonas futianensis]|uniref:serine hydrolase domain-containing protein n=1 Tax=Mangrovimonas futianensis TaxID=2895523 RepID=UPI001E3C38B4|nr:serine hydrolase domain-containing protein [Mangrovimonas futianensis]MCF1422874.1 beta-lactamase family protein [Mangrovimonas futianensis]